MNKEEVYKFLKEINREIKPFVINILKFNFSLGKIDIDYTPSPMLRDRFYKSKEEFEKALIKVIPFCTNRYEALYYTISTMSYCFNAKITLDKNIFVSTKLELE